MVFGVILAAGTGSRMGNIEKPKQYLNIGNKPVIVYTIEKFFVHHEFEEIIVLCAPHWIAHARELIKRYFQNDGRIKVIEGGATRNETIMNSIRYIEEKYGLDEQTVVVTHDSVRPFLTYRIIRENIEYAQKYGACDTVIPATDTIVESGDGISISNIPNRKLMYQGQTPQSFKAKMLKAHYESLSEKEKEILTDAAKICVIKGQKVRLVRGEVFNIKITYPYDLKVAETIIKGEV